MIDTDTRNRIAHATRQMMQSERWDWRYQDYHDAIEARAAEILRRDYQRASSWLRRVSDMTALPLPLGNGTNGPWNRIPYVTDSGRYGLVDIAKGLAVEYDVLVPSYVRRFAQHVEDRAISVHQAGGSGGAPTTWTQIAVVLGGAAVRVVAPREVQPLRIITGLSTCYGTIGGPVESTDMCWGTYTAVPQTETDEPQREEVPLGSGVDPEMWQQFMRQRAASPSRRYYPATITTSGAHRVGRVYVRVFGSRAARAETIEAIMHDWREYVRRACLTAMRGVWERSGLPMPASRGGLKSGHDWPRDPLGYGDAALAAEVVPDPLSRLSDDDLDAVRRVAEQLLSHDPVAVGRQQKYGRAGHIGYVARDLGIEYSLSTDAYWTHVYEWPGVRDWYARVDAAAQDASGA